MPIPMDIASGFDFDEAIWMAELSRRAYKIFENDTPEINTRELYNSLYKDEWRFVHCIRDYETNGRVFILKREHANQFAIAFRGSIFTDGGIELTNAHFNEDATFIEYPPIPGELTPPSRRIRVHRGWYEAFDAMREEIELFFKVYTNNRIEHRDFARLQTLDSEECSNWIGTIAAAVGLRFGGSIEKRVTNVLTKALRQEDKQKVDETALDFALLTKEVKFHQVLADLAEPSAPKPPAATPSLEDNTHVIQVYITGHSLGGCLATFCAIHLKRYWGTREDFPPFKIKMYNFGSPRIGTKDFVNYYNAHMRDYSHRVQNLLDSAIRMPTVRVPFPWNLNLMLPGVDYVRRGDEYYANYEHVGEAYTLVGLGSQGLDLDFGGPFKLTLPVPFPHGPDGYKAMLEVDRARQERFWRPARTFARACLREQSEQIIHLQKQVAELQKTVSTLSEKQVEERPTLPQRGVLEKKDF